MRKVDPTRRELLVATAALGAVPTVLAGCAPGVDDAPTDETDGAGETDTDPADDTEVAGDDTAPEGPPEVEFDARLLPLDVALFGRALAAGAMTPRGARLVTHVDWGQGVGVRVWRVVERPRVLLAYDAVVTPGDGGFVGVDVTGLEPGEVHEYAFFRLDRAGEPEARSEIGTFRTPPREDERPVFTVALGSCNGEAKERTEAMGLMADHPEIDALLHVGDLAYNDGADTLGEFRASWEEWTSSEGYKAGLASVGMYATWDDHEVDNNWSPENTSAQKVAAAKQAWTEAAPVVLNPDGTIWRSYRWGSTAEILVLDGRGERRPSTRGGDDLYLSRAQMDWFKDRLKNSPCRFKIVMNSVPITNMPSVWDLAADDRWEGYPKQRREVLDWIDEHDIADVWFLSGDFHVCFVGKVQGNRPGRSGKLWEIAVTSGNTNPLGAVLQPPQFRYGVALPRLVTVTFDPGAGTVTARFYVPGEDRLDKEVVLSQDA